MLVYLFTHMNILEGKIIPIIKNILNFSQQLNLDFNVLTILWHDNVLKIKWERIYPKNLEFLSS